MKRHIILRRILLDIQGCKFSINIETQPLKQILLGQDLFVVFNGRGGGKGKGMRFPVNVRIPGFEPGHFQDDLTTSQSYYHKFYVFQFLGKEDVSGCLSHDSTPFIEGTIDIKGAYRLRHLFQGNIHKEKES